MKKLNISRIILGYWRLQDISVKEIIRLLNTSLDAGINTIDQADIYGNYTSQSILGRAFLADKNLRKMFKIIGKAGIVLNSKPKSGYKINFYDTSRKHIVESVNQTLKDLGTDYLDCLLIHRPDQLMNPYEIDSTFQELMKEGKVLHFGVSNFTPSQFNMMQSSMKTSLEFNQVEFSALHFKPLLDGVLDQCLQMQIIPLAWSPLAGGKIFTGTDEQSVSVRATMEDIASEFGGYSLDAIALAWLLKHPSKVHPIIGTMKVKRIKSAVEALNVNLSTEQWYRILTASQGHAVP
ncbi:MAG: aldo/keto reductase family oxidoreductase [Bacteroidales bacterium]